MDDTFLSLPDELLLYILQYLDYPTCLLFFSTCRKFRALENDEFWKCQAKSRFHVNIQLLENKTYKDKYIELAAKRKEYGPKSDNYTEIKNIAKNFGKIHPLYRKYFMNLFGWSFIERNEIMANASEGGHMEIVQLMLKKGANYYDHAMASAALGGHMDIMRLMLNKGANDYNEAMAEAARGGHMDIVQLMLSKGANKYNWAMPSAAYGGHIAIVKLMLEKGVGERSSLSAACGRTKGWDLR